MNIQHRTFNAQHPMWFAAIGHFLDYGGRAQRRRRFSTADRAFKAAWRFAPRRSPNLFGCGWVPVPILQKHDNWRQRVWQHLKKANL